MISWYVSSLLMMTSAAAPICCCEGLEQELALAAVHHKDFVDELAPRVVVGQAAPVAAVL